MNKEEFTRIKLAAFADELEKDANWRAIAKAIGSFVSKASSKPSSKVYQFGQKLQGADKYKSFDEAYGRGLRWVEKNSPYVAPIRRKVTAQDLKTPGFTQVETPDSKMGNWFSRMSGAPQGQKQWHNVKRSMGTGPKATPKYVHENVTGGQAPSITQFGDWIKHHTGTMIGQGASNLSKVKDKGLGTFLKDNWKDHQLFTRTNRLGQTIELERGPLGKFVAPATTSGMAFGAMTALPKMDQYGNTRSNVERLTSGATETAGWTVMPKAMITKLIGYDMPKMIFS